MCLKLECSTAKKYSSIVLKKKEFQEHSVSADTHSLEPSKSFSCKAILESFLNLVCVQMTHTFSLLDKTDLLLYTK